jgi:hypothetical protein
VISEPSQRIVIFSFILHHAPRTGGRDSRSTGPWPAVLRRLQLGIPEFRSCHSTNLASHDIYVQTYSQGSGLGDFILSFMWMQFWYQFIRHSISKTPYLPYEDYVLQGLNLCKVKSGLCYEVPNVNSTAKDTPNWKPR